MIKDITLGQFFPGESFLHKADPRMKIIVCIMAIVIIFIAKTLMALAMIFAVVLLLTLLGKIPLKTVIKALKPIWLIIIITSLINIFWGTGGKLLVDWKFIHIYSGGLLTALFIAARIVLLIISTSMILSYTTSPIALTDGLERLLAPLAYIKVPVHDFSMMISIAMRFIPILIEETDKIMNAQKARGASFETGSIIKRAKSLIPVFIPLFVSSIRHADELATAMECRCYTGGKGRTRMTKLKMSYRDIVLFVSSVVMIVFVIYVNRFGGGFGI